MQFSDDLLRELLATFMVEAEEHIQAINQKLLVLEKAPPADQAAELLADIFREAHSLKGAARAVNLEDVGLVAHHLETLFGRLGGGELPATPALFDIVYEALDALAKLVRVRPAEGSAGVDVAGLCARLDAAAARPVAPAASPRSLAQRVKDTRAPTPPTLSDARLPDPIAPIPDTGSMFELDPILDTAASAPAPEAGNGPAPAKSQNRPAQAARPGAEAARPRLADTTVRLSTAKLDALMEEVGELQAARLAAEQRLVELRGLLENVETWEAQSRDVRQHSRRLRLAADGLDHASPEAATLQHETGVLLEFVEKNDGRVRTIRGRLGDLRRQFEADARRLAQLMADLQDDVRRTRLLPIATVLDSFPRMVRDLARELGKEASLDLQGGETEVDRSMLEQIKDPLTHLLRNSLDHGLETPAARAAAGKPAVGAISVRAAQQGDSLRIEVADDGAGINIGRVKASAIKKGIITAEAAAALNDREALWLIFRSGLSTSAIITDLSGRGVGLDVVRENVERLNGWIEVESDPGHGTRFVFSLPLTVATSLCLLAQAGSQTFGLPVSSVVRVVRVGPDEIGHVEGGEAIQVDGRPVTLTRLADVLEMAAPATPATQTQRTPAIVVGSAERRAAFLVEALQSAQEVVIKNLPEPFLRVRHIAGAAILGTGEVALILNAADLLRSAGRGGTRTSGSALAEAEASARTPVILVVDDSITTRTLVKNILEASGYQVRVAADGQEAWTLLQHEACDLLVTDVNMPRLDGFGLTEKVRGDDRLKTLPIVLVTSLDSREDRERGIWAGADAYIVKSSFDQDVLLSTIRQLI